jgi:prepilin-type processing-associated H-X9-DG protein
MARRHVEAHPGQAAVCYVDGHVRAYQGTRRIAKTHVPRLKFPAPATVETWVSDAAGDPLLVVMAEPAASLAAELRRLIPELRALVGDDRRVLVGFDRGGWSPTLFADLDAAGFDTLTWRKAAAPTSTSTTSPSTATPTSTAAPTPGDSPTPRSPSTSPTGHARVSCSRCARSACSMPPQPGRCTS